jgi:hypothetical protein
MESGRRQQHLFGFVVAVAWCALTLGLVSCSDSSESARHVPGVYTGFYGSSSMTMVVDKTSITRVQLTVTSNSGPSFSTTNIDSTGSWLLTWNEKDWCYDYSISLPANGTSVIVKGVVGIDIEKKPTAQGTVTVGSSTGTPFHLSLQQ